MKYTVSRLAKISGVSARTLRYYDQIDLLKPKRVNSNGYRIYGQDEVNLLQQILFYRELDMPLDQIKLIIYTDAFNIEMALESHLQHLHQEQERLDRLINNVSQSLQARRGDIQMSDEAKFEAFKQQAIDKNEAQYGEEVCQKYGQGTIDKSNEKFANVTSEEWADYEKLNTELNTKLIEATQEGNPTSELAQEVCDLHRQWLEFFWPNGHYSSEAHYNISLMYVYDERFKAYYEKLTTGAAEFLNEALKIYTGQ